MGGRAEVHRRQSAGVDPLPRPRLWRLLDRVAPQPDGAAPEVAVLAVVGPAGTGKTTLVTSWLRQRRSSAYRIDGSLASSVGELIDLARRAGAGDLVVIDEIHGLEPGLAAEAVQALVDAGTPVLTVGRVGPPAPFWRLLGRGRAALVGFADLLYTRSELAALGEARGWGLGVVDDLMDLTSGWPALVELARSGADDGGVPPGAARSFLATEVLDHLPVDLRDFCVRVNVLGEFSAPQAEAALDLPGAGIEIERLLRDHPVVLAARSPEGDRSGEWYRFPAMFGQVLSVDPLRPGVEEESATHRRASEWFERRDIWDRALSHMLLTSPRHAVGLLNRMLAAVEPLGRTEEVLARFRRLPGDLRMEPASINGLCLALIQAGLAQEARHLVERTDASAWRRGDQRAELLMVDAMALRVLGQHETALEVATSAQLLLASAADVSERRRAYLTVMIAEQQREIALWRHADSEAQHQRRVMGSNVARAESQLSLIHATSMSAIALWEAGSLDAAVEMATTALHLSETRRLEETHVSSEARLVLAAAGVERDRTADVRGRLEWVAARAREGLFPTTRHRSDLMLAEYLARSNDVGSAHELVEGVAAVAREGHDPWLVERLLATATRVGILAGDRDATVTSARRLRQATRTTWGLRVQVQAALFLGHDAGLAEVVADLSRSDRPLDQLTAHLAGTRLAGSGPDRAQHLLSALRTAERHGLWRSALDLAGHTTPLLASVRDEADLLSGPTPTFVRSFTAALVARARVDQPVLSGREAEVAELLPTRLTNSQIAAQLFISENTVKTHLRHIYQKLEVEHRDAAVTRLRQLGLLSPGG